MTMIRHSNAQAQGQAQAQAHTDIHAQARLDADADARRNAWNAAFHDLGLSWYWDAGHYASLVAGSDERTGLRAYLAEHQPHLLSAHDADFLIAAILAARDRCHAQLSAAGCTPGAFINWSELQQRQIGN